MPLPLRSKVCSKSARASLALLVAALLLTGTPPAHAATTTTGPPPLPSLRHLVFNFDVTVNDLTETKIEGMAASSSGGNSGSSPGVSPDSGSRMTAGQTQKRSASTSRKGQIVLDVVAATADLGLVVDVKQVSPDKSEPLTRVAITQDGGLSYDPNFELSAEEIALLRLLGRGVIGGAARAKGDEWTIPQSGSGYNEQTTYKVVDLPNTASEVIDETSVFQQTGIHPADGTVHGKITFDPTVVVPDSATLTSHIRHASLGASTTTDMTIDLSLAEDSFAKKKAP